MRAIVLGAGASISAGYPKSEDLFKSLEQDAIASQSDNLMQAWKSWPEAVTEAPPEIQILLTAKNPEIALSILDLCELFIRENFTEMFPGTASEAAAQSLYRDQIEKRLFATPAHAWLDRASVAKNRLLLLLSEYFTWKSEDDRENPDRRAYLQELVRDLNNGDVIVTLNWDTTIERTLLELGRWKSP